MKHISLLLNWINKKDCCQFLLYLWKLPKVCSDYLWSQKRHRFIFFESGFRRIGRNFGKWSSYVFVQILWHTNICPLTIGHSTESELIHRNCLLVRRGIDWLGLLDDYKHSKDKKLKKPTKKCGIWTNNSWLVFSEQFQWKYSLSVNKQR